MTVHKLRFESRAGHTLVGLLELPAHEPRAYALFAHCFTCGKDQHTARRVGRELAAHGIATLRFDFTGLGESGGDFSSTTFSASVDDVVAAAGALERDYRAPRLLVGHSLGGAAVIRAAARIPSATAVATIGAPFHPGHTSRLLSSARDAARSDGSAQVTIGGRTFILRQTFFDDAEAAHLAEAIGGLRRALLVLHSPLDEIVAIDHALLIFEAARQPKSLLSLDTADHLLSEDTDARYAAAVLAVWADRYL